MIKYYLEALKKYATFSGRARRKEYWYFALMNWIISFCLSLPFLCSYLNIIFQTVSSIDTLPTEDELLLATLTNMSPISIVLYVLAMLYQLAIFIPSLALWVRRLHDIGKSGKFLLLILVFFIPLVNILACIVLPILFLVWACTDSQIGENKYGADPKAEERMA